MKRPCRLPESNPIPALYALVVNSNNNISSVSSISSVGSSVRSRKANHGRFGGPFHSLASSDWIMSVSPPLSFIHHPSYASHTPRRFISNWNLGVTPGITKAASPPRPPRLWTVESPPPLVPSSSSSSSSMTVNKSGGTAVSTTNTTGTTSSQSYTPYSITPPRPMSATVQRHEIMSAPVGTLSMAQIELLVSGIEQLCRVSSGGSGGGGKAKHHRETVTSREPIHTAERYLYRWIQEVNSVATTAMSSLPLSQAGSVSSVPNSLLIPHHKLVIPLKIWKVIIRACASLPLPTTTTSRTSSTSTTVSSSSAPPPTTTTFYPFQIAHGHLQHMIQLHQMYPTFHLAPTEVHYSTVLYACSKCSAMSTAAVTLAEALIRTLEENAATAALTMTTSSFTITSPTPTTATTIIAPTVEMYNNVILAHANRASTVYGAAAAAEDWLMHMSAMANNNNNNNDIAPTSNTRHGSHTSSHSTHPDTRTFNRVLKAWCNSPEEQGGNRAADILHLMTELVASGIEHSQRVGPDVVSFGTVITAFAKRRQPEQCQVILEEAVRYFYQKTGGSSSGTKPEEDDLNQCWNATLFAWAQSGYPDAPERVESLIVDGIRVSPTHCERMKRLDTATYAACIDAHLQSGRPNRVEQAERHLRSMIKQYRHHLQSRHINTSARPVSFRSSAVARPTTKEFDTVIHAWYRCLDEYEGTSDVTNLHEGMENRRRRPFGYTATYATNLLRAMMDLSDTFRYSECAPTTGTFNMCIDSWCNTANACITSAKRESDRTAGLNAIDNDITDRVRAYRTEMKEQAMSSVTNAVGVLEIAENRRLSNDFSYSTILDSLRRIEDTNCALLAAKILERWEIETDKRELPWPSTAQLQYASVIVSLGKVETLESAELALKILQGIPNNGPRSLVDKGSLYTLVLGAFGTLPRAGEVATELYRELHKEDKDSSNNTSLSTKFCERVLWALAATKDKVSAGLACEVLTTMLDLHILGRPNIEPSSHCFNACIQALTEHDDVEYINFAVHLLRAIVDQYETKQLSQLPSPAAFYRVIKACKDKGSVETVQQANVLVQAVERLLKTAGR